MTLMNPVSNAMIALQNSESRNLKSCTIWPASNLVGKIMQVLQRYGYIGEFEFIDDGKAGMFKVQLLGRINKSKAVRPRWNVKADDYTEWEKKLLPAYNVGVIIVTTSEGVMSHIEAREKRLGGKLLAFVY
ncbi:MAG TPA: 30S ribosomal protein S8 [Thermoproteota archaeon]|nr:30S ribosomal protein S8 [Thermoproteota archaeon]